MMHQYNHNDYGHRAGNWSRPAKGLRSFLRMRIVVDETVHSVLVTDGRIERVLATGIHKIRPRRDRVVSIPAVDQQVIVAGQEMLTADGAGIRATIAATVRVLDPMLVVGQGGWRDAFYLNAQLALRNLVAVMALEELLGARARLDTDLNLTLAPQAAPSGLDLVNVAVRDLIVPGELRRAVADVVAARLEGQATLERARSETAAMRSLANAARAAADNPALLQLRMLQQMEQSTGNTYVLGATPLLGT